MSVVRAASLTHRPLGSRRTGRRVPARINGVTLGTVILVLLIFEDPISGVLPAIGYFDEIVALLGAVFYFVMARAKARPYLGVWIPLTLYSAVGFVSALLYGGRPLMAIGIDWFLAMKFFFALSFGIVLYSKAWDGAGSIVEKLVKTLTLFFAFATVGSLLAFYVLHTPLTLSSKTGLPEVTLFYSHGEYLAAAQLCLLLLTLAYADSINNCGKWVLVEVFVIFCTMHYKAMAVAALAVFVYITVVRWGGRFKKRYLLFVCLAVLLVGWDYFQLNYGSGATSARGMLQSTSFEIARDYFPIGTGFSTYASYMSRVYYSPLYFQYGLSNVWGLQDSLANPSLNGSFISDTFWPMVIGQTGVLGTVLFAIVLLRLCLLAGKARRVDRCAYATLVCALAYLLIQSTGSAAFVGPNAVPVALVMGLMYSKVHLRNLSESNRE